MEVDPFDPRHLDFDWPCFISSSNSGHRARVDFEDYLHFSQWLWRYKPSRNGGEGALFRTVKVKVGASWVSKNEWLHVAVVVRQGVEPPSPEHTIVDHADSDHMNCLRENLRWATPSQNAFNRKGRCKDGFDNAVYSRPRDANRRHKRKKAHA